MTLIDLKNRLLEDFSLDESKVTIDKNRYNDDLGSIFMISQIPENSLRSSIEKYHHDKGFHSDTFDGSLSFSQGVNQYLVITYSHNGTQTIEVSRNHFLHNRIR